MRRIDIPAHVLQLTADTIETAFPTANGALAADYLSRISVEIWHLGAGGCAPCDNLGTVILPVHYTPTVISDECGKIGPVDCNGVGGSYLVPSFRVATRGPYPPIIPVIGDVPVYGGAYYYYDRAHPVLVYPAFRIDEQGRVAVRWDQKLHALAAGRYEARVVVDGLTCGVFEIDKTYCCPVDVAGMQSVELEDVAARPPKPEGLTDMFDHIFNWSSVTTCQLEAGDTEVSVKDTGLLCTKVICHQPELIITDGVTKETLVFIGCRDGKLLIERSGTATIQAGAIIRFEWTPNNVKAAMEGC